MRENLESPGESLLAYFIPDEIIETRDMNPKIRQHITEQETDTLVMIKPKGKKPFLFHLEFQSTNHNRIAARMASYDYMLHLKYNMDVVSAVIYIGSAPMTMKNTVSFNGNHYACRIIDIREMDPEIFLGSERSKEIVFAILAGNDESKRKEIIRRIFSRLLELLPDKEPEFRKRVMELEILSGLRGKEIHQQIIREGQKMPIVYDIRNDMRYQQGKSEGEMEIARRMLEKGFAVSVVENITGMTNEELEKLNSAIKQQKKN